MLFLVISCGFHNTPMINKKVELFECFILPNYPVVLFYDNCVLLVHCFSLAFKFGRII